MSTTVSRKSFLTSLGAAGVGAGLLRFAPRVAAQDTDDDNREGPDGTVEPGDWEQMRTEMYADFTAALAAELGNTTADDVDAAIRKAIMSLIDAHVSDDELTKGQAEALKVIVATTDVPITPGFMGMGLGMGPGMHGGMGMGMHGEMRGEHGHGMGHGDGMGPGRGRVRIREHMDDGHNGRKRGDLPVAPGAPEASSAPGAPGAAATPEAGA